MYIWEQSIWSSLTWDEGTLAVPLAAARHEQGKLLGKMEAVGFDLREEAMLQTLTQDIVKTSGNQSSTRRCNIKLAFRCFQGDYLLQHNGECRGFEPKGVQYTTRCIRKYRPGGIACVPIVLA
jgi:hypothetical protein